LDKLNPEDFAEPLMTTSDLSPTKPGHHRPTHQEKHASPSTKTKEHTYNWDKLNPEDFTEPLMATSDPLPTKQNHHRPNHQEKHASPSTRTKEHTYTLSSDIKFHTSNETLQTRSRRPLPVPSLCLKINQWILMLASHPPLTRLCSFSSSLKLSEACGSYWSNSSVLRIPSCTHSKRALSALVSVENTL